MEAERLRIVCLAIIAVVGLVGSMWLLHEVDVDVTAFMTVTGMAVGGLGNAASKRRPTAGESSEPSS